MNVNHKRHEREGCEAADQFAIQNKLTLVSTTDGSRILSAYYDDNYITLLPGESREIELQYPAPAGKGPAQLTLRGWNLTPRTITIAESK